MVIIPSLFLIGEYDGMLCCGGRGVEGHEPVKTETEEQQVQAEQKTKKDQLNALYTVIKTRLS